MPLGDNIKKYRELRNLSVQDLAEKMGIGKAGIYKWESGETKPGLDSLTDLSKALDVSIDQLMHENPTSVQQSSNNKHNGMNPRETFYEELMEKNKDYFVAPRSIFTDYKIVPDKIIDVIIQSGENERKAMKEAKDMEMKGLIREQEALISAYENKIKRLEGEKEDIENKNRNLEKEKEDLLRQISVKKEKE